MIFIDFLRKSSVLRTTQAAIGPATSSLAQFIFSYTLLRILPEREFGIFSFFLLATQFSWGVSSALFCAPLPIAYHSPEPIGARHVAALQAWSMVFSVLSAAIFVFFALLLGENGSTSLLLGSYAGLALIRWFARADAYSRSAPKTTITSDIIYAFALMASTALLFLKRQNTPQLAACGLCLSAFIGLIPFGTVFYRQQLAALKGHVFLAFRDPWRQHGRWALLGVITTEATANAHAYLVTLLSGPQQFAPLAASALLIRPITVAMNAMTEFERVRFARDYAARHITEMLKGLHSFRVVLAIAWLGSAGLAALIFLTRPHLVFPSFPDLRPLVWATLLWMLIAGVRAARTPDSALLQAVGSFRSLAFASVSSAGASILLVWVLLTLYGPLWSIVGILVGECLFAWNIIAIRHRWQQAQEGHR